MLQSSGTLSRRTASRVDRSGGAEGGVRSMHAFDRHEVGRRAKWFAEGAPAGIRGSGMVTGR